MPDAIMPLTLTAASGATPGAPPSVHPTGTPPPDFADLLGKSTSATKLVAAAKPIAEVIGDGADILAPEAPTPPPATTPPAPPVIELPRLTRQERAAPGRNLPPARQPRPNLPSSQDEAAPADRADPAPSIPARPLADTPPAPLPGAPLTPVIEIGATPVAPASPSTTTGAAGMPVAAHNDKALEPTESSVEPFLRCGAAGSDAAYRPLPDGPEDRSARRTTPSRLDEPDMGKSKVQLRQKVHAEVADWPVPSTPNPVTTPASPPAQTVTTDTIAPSGIAVSPSTAAASLAVAGTGTIAIPAAGNATPAAIVSPAVASADAVTLPPAAAASPNAVGPSATATPVIAKATPAALVIPTRPVTAAQIERAALPANEAPATPSFRGPAPGVKTAIAADASPAGKATSAAIGAPAASSQTAASSTVVPAALASDPRVRIETTGQRFVAASTAHRAVVRPSSSAGTAALTPGEPTDRLLRARPNTAFPADPVLAPVIVDTAAPMATRAEASAPALPAVDTQHREWRTQMVERIEHFATADPAPGRETRITLSPDALGEVAVRLRETDRGIEVVVDAVPEARALLAEAAPRLSEMAEARGLRLTLQQPGQQAAGDGSTRQQPRQAPDAPIPNRRAATAASDTPTDERIA